MKATVIALVLAFTSFAILRQPAFAADAPPTLQSIVQRADEQQALALARNDPTLMRDTAADDYYRQLVQTNRALLRNGVTAIELIKLEWGPASVKGSLAELIAFETWRTTYADGTTEESREKNVYTLTQSNGSWKIQDDQHPDAGVEQPVPGTPGTTPPNRPVRAGPGQSRNWSGYAAAGGNFTSVSGTWTIPQVNATGSYASDAAWVGIGGVESHDLIQAGTSAEISSTGRIRYRAWVEMLPAAPHPLPLAVKPGDSVTFTVSEQAANQWVITARNITTGQSTSVDEEYTSSHSSAEWVEEAPAANRQVLPLSHFGTIHFSSGSAVKNGQTVTIGGAGAQSVTMIDQAGRPIATPSSLAADAASFAVTRVDQPALATGPTGQGGQTGSPGRPSRLGGSRGRGLGV